MKGSRCMQSGLWLSRIIILSFTAIILAAPLLPIREARDRVEASALAAPPTVLRSVIYSSVDSGSLLTTVPVTINLSTIGASSAGSVTRSLLIGNDAATDATGHSDLLVNVTPGTAAATPTNGSAGSNTVRIFPGKEYNFDGQFVYLSIAARLTSIPVHIFASY